MSSTAVERFLQLKPDFAGADEVADVLTQTRTFEEFKTLVQSRGWTTNVSQFLLPMAESLNQRDLLDVDQAVQALANGSIVPALVRAAIRGDQNIFYRGMLQLHYSDYGLNSDKVPSWEEIQQFREALLEHIYLKLQAYLLEEEAIS